MDYEKKQPTADCIVARLVPSWGSIVSLLFKATEPYEHYYDEHGEEVPYGAIESWTDVELPPEPENEDEKMRKHIIDIIKDNAKSKCIPCDAEITYLEKQKEQKPLMSDGEIEDTKRDIVAAIRKYYSSDYAKYLTSFLKGLSPEDNSDDEYGQEMLGIAYKLMYEHIPENLRTQEFWDSLKFMREYTGKVAIIHSYEKPAEIDEYEIIKKHITEDALSGEVNKRLKECGWYVTDEKPAEWSEEDEKLLNYAISMTDDAQVKRFLESLKNRGSSPKSNTNSPHWKPSEEQMKLLDVAIAAALDNNKSSNLASGLITLRKDLEKLM